MNIEQLRLQGPSAYTPPTARPPRPGPKEHFLKVPVPLGWLRAAAKQPGKAMSVGMYIWYLAGLTKRNRFALPTSKLKLFGVDRSAQYRALNALESAGLILVERQRGRHAVITLQNSPSEHWNPEEVSHD